MVGEASYKYLILVLSSWSGPVMVICSMDHTLQFIKRIIKATTSFASISCRVSSGSNRIWSSCRLCQVPLPSNRYEGSAEKFFDGPGFFFHPHLHALIRSTIITR